MRADQRDTEFVEFVSAQRTALLRMARLLTAGEEASAEDLVQTTLTRLYVHWPRVRRAGNPVGYARTSLTHAFVDEQRRAYKRRETPTDTVQEPAVHEQDYDLPQTVLAALRTLAPRQRAVVVLRHFLDLDVAQTARRPDRHRLDPGDDAGVPGQRARGAGCPAGPGLARPT
jgi:RNA polymerase sigma factor (sigma-70 family)